MKAGRYTVSLHVLGWFRLDGGAMFGSVPKNLWSKLMPVDEENCIRLATRSLLLEDNKRKILVDVGNGEKWNDKLRTIFAIENAPQERLGFSREEISDVLLTHLHFDHAGGISEFSPEGTLQRTYPNAKIHVQRANFDNARAPGLRERASYLPENVDILLGNETNFLDGDVEPFPEVRVKRVDGHTVGQQYIEVFGGPQPILFPTDLIPTSRHLPLPYNMGYDICANTLLEEKKQFLEYAIEHDAIVVFEHDPDVAAARIHVNQKGHYAVKEVVEF